MIVWKQIKAKALKQKALRLELLNAMRSAGRAIKKDFDRTTLTWRKRPIFEMIISLRGGPQVFVYTDNEIYGYVSRGTEEHVIVPVDAKALRFRSGYIAKTKPRIIGSFSGGPYGKVVLAAAVLHPGTEAREFDKVLRRRWQPRFKKRMEKAMRRARQKSGHAI